MRAELAAALPEYEIVDDLDAIPASCAACTRTTRSTCRPTAACSSSCRRGSAGSVPAGRTGPATASCRRPPRSSAPSPASPAPGWRRPEGAAVALALVVGPVRARPSDDDRSWRRCRSRAGPVRGPRRRRPCPMRRRRRPGRVAGARRRIVDVDDVDGGGDADRRLGRRRVRRRRDRVGVRGSGPTRRSSSTAGRTRDPAGRTADAGGLTEEPVVAWWRTSPFSNVRVQTRTFVLAPDVEVLTLDPAGRGAACAAPPPASPPPPVWLASGDVGARLDGAGRRRRADLLRRRPRHAAAPHPRVLTAARPGSSRRQALGDPAVAARGGSARGRGGGSGAPARTRSRRRRAASRPRTRAAATSRPVEVGGDRGDPRVEVGAAGEDLALRRRPRPDLAVRGRDAK